jgi:hypothetical protein
MSTDPANVPAQGSLHTPGPWLLNWNIAGGGQHEDYPELYYVNIHSANYLDVAPHGLSLTGYVRPADARLIAAAPELLEALKRLARAYVSTMESGRDRIVALGGDCDPVDVMERGDPYLRIAKEAIAKAEGQS